MMPTGWQLRRDLPAGPEPWRALAQACGLSPALARLAWMRGVNHPDDLACRLDPSWERTHDPYLMPGMAAAVARIQKAVAAGEPITVYGDYDVDGVTATAVLVRVLERLGAKVGYFIPNRFSDGYGLHLDCIRDLATRKGPGLLVSVDCGIRSTEEVAASRELGLAWVITDHHALGPELPEADAILHPALGDYPNPVLSGVGVAFKLAQALMDAVPLPKGADAAFLDGLLKLVALGTVADMVPLTGENATLVRRGLASLGGNHGPGLTELLKAARITGVPTASDLSFGPVPRLNAVGRMGGAEDAVRLLLTRDPAEAATLMKRVEQLNEERRAVQRDLDQRLPEPGDVAFDLALDPEAHKGVLGIVASRRMRRTGLPTAVCTVIEDIAHGSMRAPEGYDCCAMLDVARPFLRSGGGHRAAAGMSFERAKLPFVRRALEQEAARQGAGRPPASLTVDGEGWDWMPEADQLARLEPFGQGFPAPLVVLSGALERTPQAFGEGHLRLRLEGVTRELTWFFGQEQGLAAKAGTHLQVAVSPSDHVRFGRSWRVEALTAEGQA